MWSYIPSQVGRESTRQRLLEAQTRARERRNTGVAGMQQLAPDPNFVFPETMDERAEAGEMKGTRIVTPVN